MKSNTLRVPGANIYYQQHGSGPLLLILQGGDGDADGTSGVVEYLVDHYTVVTYDRRGLSRSTLDGAADSLRLETHGDDVHRLLAKLTGEPVFVFGTSIGGLIGLDLVTHHPEQVHALIAHEPPAPELLPDAARARAVQAQEGVEATYRQEGVAGAMRKFAAMAGLNFDDHEPDVVFPRPTPQRATNLAFFLAHDAPAVRQYRLDLAALKAATTRIVPAGGHTSREIWTHQCARALAEQLGAEMVEFPGGHNGNVTHPRAFAARLQDALDGRSETSGAPR
jgi:pimeloyl-ACP methyl ester carboxylesterase